MRNLLSRIFGHFLLPPASIIVSTNVLRRRESHINRKNIRHLSFIAITLSQLYETVHVGELKSLMRGEPALACAEFVSDEDRLSGCVQMRVILRRIPSACEALTIIGAKWVEY